MNLVLIGYRGTGKSVVAEILSQELGMNVVSLDAEIVREAGMPIPEIVEKHGWPWFRDLESAVTKRFAERDGLILDTGGGVILRPENTESLSRSICSFSWSCAKLQSTMARSVWCLAGRPLLPEVRRMIGSPSYWLSLAKKGCPSCSRHSLSTTTKPGGTCSNACRAAVMSQATDTLCPSFCRRGERADRKTSLGLTIRIFTLITPPGERRAQCIRRL